MPESVAFRPDMGSGQVFAGRARAVVGSDPAADDPTVVRERSWLAGPDQEPPARTSLGVRMGLLLLLAVAGALVSGLAMALAAR